MPASTRPFMGATPYDTGTTFRVWAPFAEAVAVAGGFNNWSITTALPLFSEGAGYWSVDVPGAAIGAEYKFLITNPDQPSLLWKNDPYARELTQSNGNSVIADPNFSWDSGGYSTPPWNESIIYEVHVGSFLFDSAATERHGWRDPAAADAQRSGAERPAEK